MKISIPEYYGRINIKAAVNSDNPLDKSVKLCKYFICNTK